MTNLTFPAPNSTDMATPANLLQYINVSLVDNMLGIGLLIVVFSIAFISLSRRYDLVTSFMTAVFITTVLSFPLFVLEILNGSYVTALILITALSAFLYRDK